MAKRSFIREWVVLGTLAAAGLVAVAIGYYSAGSLIERRLESHARAMTAHWIDRLDSQTGRLREIFRDRRLATGDYEAVASLEALASVRRVGLHDASGALFFSRGNAGDFDFAWGDETEPEATRARPPAGGFAELHKVSVDDHVQRFGRVALPVTASGDTVGSIDAIVDLTGEAARFAATLDRVAAFTALLLAIAIGLPAAFLLLRMRDQQRAETRLQFLSRHDKLTGLLDCEAFSDRFEHMVTELGAKPETQLALVRLAIDDHEDLVGELGYKISDSLIKVLAHRLMRNVRDIDVVGRLDTSEFGMILTDIVSAEDVVLVVERVAKAAMQPYILHREHVVCGVSLGVAMATDASMESETVLRNASLALRAAQSGDASKIAFFEAGMDEAYETQRNQAGDLREAIRNEDFEIHYQPQVQLEDYTICGHEALVRWPHRERGDISPVQFIPMAEESELIVPLGEWILRRACRDAANWPEPRKVAVNLSPIQFHRINVAELVQLALDESGLAPHELELEITENLLMSDSRAILAALERLREIGVGIALDDFGTGYSSLSYLARFPFTKIKIDRSFMHGLNRDKAVDSIIDCIVALGRSLDVTITAEGVETHEQAELLKELGCHEAQGYLYGRPAPAGEALRRLRTGAPLRMAKPATAGAGLAT